MLLSLAFLPAFAAIVFGQGSAIPDQSTTTPAVPVITDCSGCYVVADIAQVFFGTQQLTETQTQIVSQGSGRNGTQITTTFNQPLGQFSFNPSGIFTGPITGEFAFPTGTVITVNGAALTSPTAYNVFTAYTVSSLSQNGGSCVTVSYATQVDTAFSVMIPDGAPASFVFDAEQSFIDSLPALTCNAAGAVISMTTAIPVSITTTTSTTSGIFRPTPIAQTTGPSTAASTTTSEQVSSLTTEISGSETVVLVTPSSPSIAIGAASGLVLGTTSLSSSLFAVLFVLPGLGAWLL